MTPPAPPMAAERLVVVMPGTLTCGAVLKICAPLTRPKGGFRHVGRAAPPPSILERRGLTATAPAEAVAAAHESPESPAPGDSVGGRTGSACRREPAPRR